MNDDRYSEILLKHDIKLTANRIVIVKTLSQAGYPLSLSELESKIVTIDKSNIFRVINIFKRQHLIHAIDSGAAGTRYELCHSVSYDTDEDMHTHFYCVVCHRTLCLDATPIPVVELPEGYEATSVSYLIKGVCPSCAKKLISPLHSPVRGRNYEQY